MRTVVWLLVGVAIGIALTLGVIDQLIIHCAANCTT